MGRRAARKQEAPKPKPKLDTQFNCLFCHNVKCVQVKMDRTAQLGILACRICSANFQMRINYLSEPVDVFCEWTDQAEAINEGDAAL